MFAILNEGTIISTNASPNRVDSIEIVSEGILVRKNSDTDSLTFFPWHRIKEMQGNMGEFEHELEQFYHLGIGD